MQMGRTCRKASPRQMDAGNDYVGPLQKQAKQRQAKYQLDRLLHRNSGTTLVQSDERENRVESNRKSAEKINKL